MQYAASEEPPRVCAICEDDRQWVPRTGQQWTTLGELREEGHRGDVRELEPGLVGIGVTPPLGIGQRALLAATPAGNVLWDCVGYLDDELVGAVHDHGGVAAIAASHPHFYGAMAEWANAFDAPMFLPSVDREWVVRADADIRWWEDEVEVAPGVRALRCGGHFAGSAVLHWPPAAGGRGAVFVGDTATVVADRRHVSFMRSYPNLVPLPAPAIERIVATMSRYPFERIYGAWWDREILADGPAALRRSADRYLAHSTGERVPE